MLWQVLVQPLASLLLWLGTCHVSQGTGADRKEALFCWAVPRGSPSSRARGSVPETLPRSHNGSHPDKIAESRAEMDEHHVMARAQEGNMAQGERVNMGQQWSCAAPAAGEGHMDGATWVSKLFSHLPLGTAQGLLWASCLSACYLTAVTLFKHWTPWTEPGLPSSGDAILLYLILSFLGGKDVLAEQCSWTAWEKNSMDVLPDLLHRPRLAHIHYICCMGQACHLQCRHKGKVPSKQSAGTKMPAYSFQ